MSGDDEFEPRLGRMRATPGRRARKYLHRVLATANLIRGGGTAPRGSPGFTGSRIGRGAGVGRVLARRDRHAAFRRRRVVVKHRLARLDHPTGIASARRHLGYLQRDGVTREGRPGELYGKDADRVDGNAWLDRQQGDRHQHRFIVSPEDGDQYPDLKDLTRRLMARMEEDLGTQLDWAAVDHFNTGHPHTHVVIRGKDDTGRDLVIARDYITRGLRERAAELVDLDLGPRVDRDIEDRLRAEVAQERLTGIDRNLIRDMDADRIVDGRQADPFQQSLRTGRLATLERLGLAEKRAADRWRLSDGLEDTLRRMGERGDIIRTMQRAFTARGIAPAAADVAIYDPAADGAWAIVGRVVERGLSEELADRHYLIVEATDGRAHYVDIGKGEAMESLPTGAVVRIAPPPVAVREVDRTVLAVATANGGRYDAEAHLRHDPRASETFAAAHVRRLEAIRQRTGGVERAADGSWAIAPDHLDRVEAYEAARAKDAPVRLDILSTQPIEKLADRDAATWLDRELVAETPEPLREAGFGQVVREAQERRRQWLIAQGLAEEAGGDPGWRAALLGTLRRRELLRVAATLSEELGLHFVETRPGDRIEGVCRKAIDLADGRYAVIEKSKEFTLVPWRPVLDRQIGRSVSGVMRRETVSWTIGRDRGGPGIA
ncbi:relaxase/mobilization nuclease RlxS [Sphingomonas adhaesiva]|uniref:relaxase/mobilization nuclease RlxS n=1 Tax=Sphingomonas adhaesiva TaxID=28212 RepID=UPI002FF97AA0